MTQPNLSPATPLQSELAIPPPRRPTAHTLRRYIHPRKIGLFVVSIFLFVLAITLMKEGARDLAPLIRSQFAVTNVANSLGFGWLFAYLILSGSPVAAAALAFLDVGAIDPLHTFAMISGSRFGGSFIVLFIGVLYILRGRDWVGGLSMGLLTLTVTVTTYLPAFLIGIGLLQSGLFDGLQFGSGARLNSIVDLIFGPIIRFLVTYFPLWLLFVIGLGLIMLSFHLFDRCLPQMTIKESQLGHVSRLIYRPWMMFILGAVVTLISMSVSISLSILVPLSHRGFIRRENVIPYIMGANVTTFIDTLLAAMLVSNPAAFTVVFVCMLSVSLVSTLIYLTVYRRYERSMLLFVDWVTAKKSHLLLFMTLIIVAPIVLMIL